MPHHHRTICHALAACACALLAGCSQSVFFQPDHLDRGTPATEGMSYHECRFLSADGTSLHGWFIPASTVADSRQAVGTVVHFHGNAQNITAHWHQVSWLPAHGFNVFVFDYRGYGASEGKPDAHGLAEDSCAALQYVRTLPQVDPARLVVFGQSLGGANAIVAVARSAAGSVKAVAIESTFSSYSAMARQKLPPAASFMDDAEAPDRVVASLSPTPILFMHGRDDTLIAPEHSQTLFALAGQPKQLLLVPGVGHMEVMTLEGPGSPREILLKFFQDALRPPLSRGRSGSSTAGQARSPAGRTAPCGSASVAAPTPRCPPASARAGRGPHAPWPAASC